MKFEQFSFMIRSGRSNKAFPCNVCLICEKCSCVDYLSQDDIVPIFEHYKKPCEKCGGSKELVLDEDIGEFNGDIRC